MRERFVSFCYKQHLCENHSKFQTVPGFKVLLTMSFEAETRTGSMHFLSHLLVLSLDQFFVEWHISTSHLDTNLSLKTLGWIGPRQTRPTRPLVLAIPERFIGTSVYGSIAQQPGFDGDDVIIREVLSIVTRKDCATSPKIPCCIPKGRCPTGSSPIWGRTSSPHFINPTTLLNLDLLGTEPR